MSARRVAVIFPQADTAEVERFRSRWDPLATSVAAHITIVFPFEWHGTAGALDAALTRVVSNHHPFAVSLTGMTIWENEYLFLLMRDGQDAVNRLHRDLYAGPLPGLVQPSPFLPHMTVGRRSQPTELAYALSEANDTQLSVDGHALALSVYRIDPGGRRVRELDIPLGPAP